MNEVALHQIIEAGIPLISLSSTKTPIAGFGKVWALLNLILAILGLAVGLFLMFSHARSKSRAVKERKRRIDEQREAIRLRREELLLAGITPEQDIADEEQEVEDIDYHEGYAFDRTLVAVFSLVGIVFFFLTENTSYLMVIVDRWTLWNLLFFLITVMGTCSSLKTTKLAKEEEKTDPDSNE